MICDRSVIILADSLVVYQLPDTFVCATTKTETANELVKHSPVTFKFVTEPLESIQAMARPGASPVNVAAPVQIHDLKEGDDQELARPTRPGSTMPDLIKTFKLHINPSQSYYEHKKTIRRNPIHGPWPKTLDEDQDSVFFALRNIVPKNVAQRGLCDWRTGGQLSEEAKYLRSSAEGAKFWHLRQRQLRRKNSQLATAREHEDELVGWTSLDPETRLRDQRLRALEDLDDAADPAATPEGPHFTHNTAPGTVPGLASSAVKSAHSKEPHVASAAQSATSRLKAKQLAREAYIERAVARGDEVVPTPYAHLRPKKLPKVPGWEVQKPRLERRRNWFAFNQFRENIPEKGEIEFRPLLQKAAVRANSLSPSYAQQSNETSSVAATVGRESASEASGLQAIAAADNNDQSSRVNASLAKPLHSASQGSEKYGRTDDDAASESFSKTKAAAERPAPSEEHSSSPPKSDDR